MLSTLLYFIFFIVYMSFNLITFDVYSKKNERTNYWVLIFIYIYYTILIGYIIAVADINGTFAEKFIEIAIFVVASAIIMKYYYTNVIVPKDDKEFKE